MTGQPNDIRVLIGVGCRRLHALTVPEVVCDRCHRETLALLVGNFLASPAVSLRSTAAGLGTSPRQPSHTHGIQPLWLDGQGCLPPNLLTIRPSEGSSHSYLIPFHPFPFWLDG